MGWVEVEAEVEVDVEAEETIVAVGITFQGQISAGWE